MPDFDVLTKWLNDNAGVLVAVGMVGTVAVLAFKATWKVLAHIYDFRKLKKEHDCVQQKYENEKNLKQQFESELAELRKIVTFRHWHFFPADPAPRMPLCPICYTEGIVIQMYAKTITCSRSAGGREADRQKLIFICPRCARSIHTEDWEQDDLLKKLEINLNQLQNFYS